MKVEERKRGPEKIRKIKGERKSEKAEGRNGSKTTRRKGVSCDFFTAVSKKAERVRNEKRRKETQSGKQRSRK